MLLPKTRNPEKTDPMVRYKFGDLSRSMNYTHSLDLEYRVALAHDNNLSELARGDFRRELLRVVVLFKTILAEVIFTYIFFLVVAMGIPYRYNPRTRKSFGFIPYSSHTIRCRPFS